MTPLASLASTVTFSLRFRRVGTENPGEWCRLKWIGYFGEPPYQAEGIYFPPNLVEPALLSRCKNRFDRNRETTKDDQILKRRWLIFDVDPFRFSEITGEKLTFPLSATNAEKDRAFELANQVRTGLMTDGWPEPVLIDSGNGHQLWYRVDAPADDGGLIERVLKAAARRFTSQYASIVTSVFNPSRIFKIPGTLARKGDETKERPHRPSEIKVRPATLIPVSMKLLEGLAGPAVANAGPATAPTHKRLLAQKVSTTPANNADVASRAGAYVMKMDPSRSG
jgi:hypothetical protein